MEKQPVGDYLVRDPGNLFCLLHRVLLSVRAPGASADNRSSQIPGGKLAFCLKKETMYKERVRGTRASCVIA